MISPRPYQIGFHAAHFDTQLLTQVVEIEIERAVRYAGIRPHDGMVVQWNERVVSRLRSEIEAEGSAHVLLPAEIDERIHDEIADLIDEYRRPSASQGMLIRDPLHGMTGICGRVVVLCRAFFEKRLE